MNTKKSVVISLSAVFLLATISFADAGPRYYGSHHGYNNHSNHTVAIESHEYCPEDHYRSNRHHHKRHHYNQHWKRHHSRHDYGNHHRGPSHVYVEKHIYKHESPRVIYQQPQPTYYPPANYQPSYQSSYGYGGNVVSETVVGGAFGAAAGAAIGAIAGDPGKGAALGAVIGGFNGIGRGVFGRGILW